MSTIIEEIRMKMSYFPNARVEQDATSITYFPDNADGFVVRLVVLHESMAGEWYSVYYNGSHEEFSDRGSAILTFGFGLSTECRVREYSRSGEAYRWVVDIWDSVRWKPDWEIVRFSPALWRAWRRPTVRFLQNLLIDLDAGNAARAA
jgi:hypothetical protein